MLTTLPASQAGDKVYEVGKAALKIGGTIADTDMKFKIMPLPMPNDAMLPGKPFQVKLQEGKRYRMAMNGTDVDSVLMVKDSAGKQPAWDDDGGGGLNALVMFDPPKNGTYTIYALSLKGTGRFALLNREAIVPFNGRHSRRGESFPRERAGARSRVLVSTPAP